MYGIIGGMREHGIVVREVVVRKGGCECFGITPNRIPLPCGNFKAVLPVEALVFLAYRTWLCTTCQCHRTVAVFPT
jgi:hypothetical protein